MKKILSVFMVLSMIASLSACGNKNEDNKTNKTETTTETQLKRDYVVGDTIVFGSYEQDNDTSNGKEPIEWEVLDKKDGKILVISKYALYSHQYHSEYDNSTWETCWLRELLNDNFLNEAFTEDEIAKIPTVDVEPHSNPDYGTDQGNITQDKVFLLSIQEANTYFSADEERICESTEYAKAEGMYINDDNNSCRWWLRTLGKNQCNATAVDYDGETGGEGHDVRFGDHAVRPAMWIEL